MSRDSVPVHRIAIPPTTADVVWALATTILCTVLILSTGGIGATVGGGDLFGYFVPKYEAVAQAILVERRIPHWNPYEYGGLPLLGAHQPAAFYPVTWLTFGLWPRWVALQLHQIVHFFVMSWGMIAYLRRYGTARPIGAAAALIAIGAVYSGRAYFGTDHPAFLAAASWLPAILLFWERSLDSARPWLGWMGLAVAAQWLAGYPEFSLDTPLLMTVVALIGTSGWRHGAGKSSLTQAGPPLRRRLLMLVAGFALGALLAAIQIAPTFETVVETSRLGSSPPFWFQRTSVLVTAVDQLPAATVGRLGPATVLLAISVLLRPTRSVFSWLAAIALTLSIGFRPFIYLYYLPVFSGIRFPVAWEMLSGVFWAAAAAVGATSAMRGSSRWRRIAAVALLLWSAAFSMTLVRDAPLRQRLDPPSSSENDLRAARLEELAEQYSDAGLPRIYSPVDAIAGTPLRHRLNFAAGYEPAVLPERIDDLLRQFDPVWPISSHNLRLTANPELAALIGVGIAVVPSKRANLMKRAGFRLIATMPQGDLVFYQKPVPRARVVFRAIYASEPEIALAKTVDPQRDMFNSVVLESTSPVLQQMEVDPGSRSASAEIVVSEPERVVVDVSLDQTGLLVLNDRYSSQWKATIDGHPAEVLRADFSFRAVVVPPGSHEVVFHFESIGVSIGVALSTLALLITGFLIGSPAARRQSARPAVEAPA